MHASPHIDVPMVDNIVLITRGPIIPAISKLTLEQASALMVLGQAMESSAGDPTKAGQIRTEFFYDPFVAGDKAFHANRFYDILKELPHIQYYLINTGSVGEGIRFKDINVSHTAGILDSALSAAAWRTGWILPPALSAGLYPRGRRYPRSSRTSVCRKPSLRKKQRELGKIPL
jgi:phosphoenolpyruvate carboxykinase (ATP)